MEERVKVLLVEKHIARVQVQSLVMQVACPEIWWRQMKIQMTLCQMSSSLTNSAPSSDVSTSDWSVLERVSACWILALWILDATSMLCSRFDEDTA